MHYGLCRFFTFSSHVIKTALLWCLDERERSSDSSDEVNEDELLILVQNIVRRLLCFAAQDFVPSYFMPKCRQPVWLRERYPKQLHTCLYEHGLTHKDLLSLTKDQRWEVEYFDLNNIKDTFIYSHIMACKVSPNTDQFEFFVPSTINPLCFDEDIQRFNILIPESGIRMLNRWMDPKVDICDENLWELLVCSPGQAEPDDDDE